MASLAYSEGWKFITPRGIQRREKLTTLPMPGISTSTSSTSARMKRWPAYFSHQASGICSTSKAATVAMPMDSRWRLRKCVAA